MKEITTKSGKVLLVRDCPGIYEIVKHTTKLSIEFAIEVLEDTDQKIMNLTGNSLEYYNLYYEVIEPKIQELKQYLDDK